MRKLLLSLVLFVCFQAAASAQLSVFFVDDSDDGYMNAETFANTFDGLVDTLVYYDCILEGAGPTETMMAEHDLVVWYTGSSGLGLYFWNANDEDNPELKSYLDNGGQLWLTGNDMLFDRYGPFSNPITFVEGSFVYDYLGVTAFEVESYTSDGNLGMPFAIPATSSSITDLPTLDWIFSTLWYADGVSIRPEAEPVYRMGDNAYVLADTICGLAYDNGTYKTATFFFDMGLVASDDLRIQTITPMLEYFTPGPSSMEEAPLVGSLEVFPNPSAGAVTIQLELDTKAYCQASVWNTLGQRVAVLCQNESLPAGPHTLTWLPNVAPGTYLLRVEIGGEVVTKTVVVK